MPFSTWIGVGRTFVILQGDNLFKVKRRDPTTHANVGRTDVLLAFRQFRYQVFRLGSHLRMPVRDVNVRGAHQQLFTQAIRGSFFYTERPQSKIKYKREKVLLTVGSAVAATVNAVADRKWPVKWPATSDP